MLRNRRVYANTDVNYLACKHEESHVWVFLDLRKYVNDSRVAVVVVIAAAATCD